MTKLVYLTFNDGPGGIFTSQVIEVCRFFRDELNLDVQLVSFISLRGFFGTRKKILEKDPSAIVLPMWPGIGNWRRNASRLTKRLGKIKPNTIIARGPFATLLAASSSSSRICYDARGAYTAEFHEYDLSNGQIPSAEIRSIEEQALISCHAAIAVSHVLVDYWRTVLGYSEHKHRVIPCTFDSRMSVLTTPHANIRIVFSGGSGKWQSIELISQLLSPLFEENPTLELLMLTRDLPADFSLKSKFPNRVHQQWVSEKEVPALLATCDYGWLVRTSSTTNKVASPVKFAEYLSAGLSVLISSELGDFSEFVTKNNCGFIVSQTTMPDLHLVSEEQKALNKELALTYFTKKAYIEDYKFCVE